MKSAGEKSSLDIDQNSMSETKSEVPFKWALSWDEVEILKKSPLLPKDYSDCAGTCFLQGSMVLLANGEEKSIEQFKGGEMIRTLTGVARVRKLDTTILGVTRRVIRLRSNEVDDAGLFLSDNHPVWTRFPDGLEWWGTYNSNHCLTEKELGIGYPLNRDAVTLRHHTVYEHAHVSGWVATRPEYCIFPSNTPLYQLLLEEGGSYIVGGFVVISQGVETDYVGARWAAPQACQTVTMTN